MDRLGLAIGALSGLALGAFYDIDTARVGEDFVDDVSKSLTPNKVAVIAEIDEEWTTPVDTRMEALGGIVFRRALWEVQEKIDDEDIAAMKADLAQFKSEISKAHADRKAKLQKKIDQLQARIDAQQKKATERREAFEARQKAKRAILKKNAAAAGRALKELAQPGLKRHTLAGGGIRQWSRTRSPRKSPGAPAGASSWASSPRRSASS